MNATFAPSFAQAPQPVKAGPVQPLPFSHKAHVDFKLQCKMCHTNPAPGDFATIMPANKCMECHSAIKTDSPAIQKLASIAKAGRDVDWVRVYKIPGYVSFSHKSHLAAGSTCEQCHGPVAQREQLFRESDISMGGCMDCHRMNNASLDCTFCHEQRN